MTQSNEKSNDVDRQFVATGHPNRPPTLFSQMERRRVLLCLAATVFAIVLFLELARIDEPLVVRSFSPSSIVSMAVSPSGTSVAIATDDNTLSFLDAGDLSDYQHPYYSSKPISAIEYSPDGSMIAIGDDCGATTILLTESLEPVAKLSTNEETVLSVHFLEKHLVVEYHEEVSKPPRY